MVSWFHQLLLLLLLLFSIFLHFSLGGEVDSLGFSCIIHALAGLDVGVYGFFKTLVRHRESSTALLCLSFHIKEFETWFE